MYARGLGGGSAVLGTSAGGLAATGAPIVLILGVAAALVVVGLVLLRCSRARLSD